MEKENSRFFVSFSEEVFEISGSEKFIQDVLKEFKEKIFASFSEVPKKTQKAKTEDEKHQDPAAGSAGAEVEGIAECDDGVVTLTISSSDLEGKTAKKMKDIAVIYLYARKQLLGKGSDQNVPTSEILSACTTIGVKDDANFASNMKDPSNLTLKGARMSKTISLTNNGERKAKELIKKIHESRS